MIKMRVTAVDLWPLVLFIITIMGCQERRESPAFEILNVQKLPSGAYSLKVSPMLIVRYSDVLEGGSFHAELNSKDVTGSFTVLPGRQVIVDLPALRIGKKNSLIVSLSSEYGYEKHEFNISYILTEKPRDRGLQRGVGLEGGL